MEHRDTEAQRFIASQKIKKLCVSVFIKHPKLFFNLYLLNFLPLFLFLAQSRRDAEFAQRLS